MPREFWGIADFLQEYITAKRYKESKYPEKPVSGKVVVVGLGNSGVDGANTALKIPRCYRCYYSGRRKQGKNT